MIPTRTATGPALVTGGGGFLGGAIVDALLARDTAVVSVSRSRHDALEEKGVTGFEIDLGCPESAVEALATAMRAEAIETVFHCAARPGVFGPRRDYEWANVAATRHVLEACRVVGVPRLVFTSSPSVVFDGRDHLNARADELTYPARYLAEYPRTKAEAERAVLDANSEALATVALRPHLVYGPGDPNLVPRLLARADAGKLRIVGDGDSIVSLTYAENGAAAHIAAADALAAAGARSPCAGRAYFVNDREPTSLWRWIDRILEGTGRSLVTKRLPARVAYAAGAVLELGSRALGRTKEPPMTRFVAQQLATSHSYDITPFVEATGQRYAQPVEAATAIERTIAWAREAFPPPTTR